jgi:putative ABC transport system permease protein
MSAEGTEVAGGFFEAVLPRMSAGRPFSEIEAEEDAPVVVLSHAFAERIVGTGPAVGMTLSVNGESHTVVGLTAPGGQLPDVAELWIPKPPRRGSGGMRNNINWRSLARIKPGVDASTVEAELSAIANKIRQTDPEAIYSYGVSMRPLREAVTADAGEYLALLMAAVLFVLLVACANPAGLSLARGRGRIPGGELDVHRQSSMAHGGRHSGRRAPREVMMRVLTMLGGAVSGSGRRIPGALRRAGRRVVR